MKIIDSRDKQHIVDWLLSPLVWLFRLPFLVLDCIFFTYEDIKTYFVILNYDKKELAKYKDIEYNLRSSTRDLERILNKQEKIEWGRVCVLHGELLCHYELKSGEFVDESITIEELVKNYGKAFIERHCDVGEDNRANSL